MLCLILTQLSNQLSLTPLHIIRGFLHVDFCTMYCYSPCSTHVKLTWVLVDIVNKAAERAL